jgi:DNA invertase Pin-like site-specific DNA recombinase
MYREEGESGAEADRTQLSLMLAFLATSKEKYIVLFDDESRVARNTKLFLTIWENIAKMGHVMATIKDGELHPEHDKLVTTIKAAVAEEQRRVIRTKSMEYMNVRLRAGFYSIGHAPRGFTIGKVDNNVFVKRKEPAATILQEALEKYASGEIVDQTGIMTYINQHPKFPASGMPKANYNFIRRFLKCPIYTGWFALPKRGIPYQEWKMEPIISRETHEVVLARMKGKYSPKERKYNIDDEILPLRRQIVCSLCEVPLTGSRPRGRHGKRYPSYHCRNKDCPAYAKTIRLDIIHPALETLLADCQPEKSFLRFVEMKALEIYRENTGGFRAAQQGKRTRIQAIERELESLSRAAMQTTSDSMRLRYERDYERLENEKSDLTTELDAPVSEPKPFAEALPMVFDVVSRPLEIWQTGDLKLKQGVLNFCFGEKLSYNRDGKFGTPKMLQILRH